METVKQISRNGKTVSTLQGLEFSGLRRDGNSTKQINKAIELIFQGYRVVVLDHWMCGEHHACNKELFDRILRRLQIENPSIYASLQLDKKELTIELGVSFPLIIDRS